MKVHFYSDSGQYLDRGPVLNGVKKLEARGDHLIATNKNGEEREVATFLINAWGAENNEVYDNVLVEESTPSISMETYEKDFRKSPCFKAAAHYLSLGWAAIALCPRDHYGVGAEHRRLCSHPGKSPVEGRWKQWQARRPTLKELEEQWVHHPNANVGVVMGSVSGLVGVDVDGDYAAVLAEAPWLTKAPPTLEFETGRGLRFLYNLPERDDVAVGGPPVSKIYRLKSGTVEVLSGGRLTVMPPSLHANGKRYRWVPKKEDRLATYRDVGPPSSRRWKRNVTEKEDMTYQPTPEEATGSIIPEGERNRTLFKAGCALRRFGAGEDEILTYLRDMNRRCRPLLVDDEIYTITKSIVTRYKPII